MPRRNRSDGSRTRHLLNIVIVMAVMAGCSQERPADSRLLEAECEVDMQPYAALRMLQPYTTDSFATAGDRALYHLLLTESMHNVGVILWGDSAISASREYYEQTSDRDRTARAQLHHALVLYEQGRRYDAVTMMKRAERTIGDNGRPAFMFSLYESIGAVNENARNTEAALAYYRRALLSARATGDTTFIVRGINNMARMFCASDRTDSLRAYVRMYHPLLVSASGIVEAEALTNIAFLHMTQGRRDEAIRTLDEARMAYPHYRTLKLQADIYASGGNIEQACELWYQVLDSSSPELYRDAYDRLVAHLYATRRYESAAYLADKRIERDGAASRDNDMAQIISIQTEFDREAAELNLYRIIVRLQWAVLLLAVAVAAVMIYHRRRVRRLNGRYEAYLSRYNTVQAELASLLMQKETDRSLIEAKTAETDRLQRQLAEYQDDHRRPDEWNLHEQLMRSVTVARLHNLAARGREAAPLDWDDLHRLAAEHLPALLHLLNTSPAVNAKETNVCLLIRLRFIPSEIATLTATSPQTITNMRVRLLLKLFGERGGARDFDARIREWQ